VTIKARQIWTLIACVAFAYCAWRVWGFVRQYRAREIVDWLAALPPENIVLSTAFAVASYVTLTGYDYIAVRYAGERLPYRRVAVASFVSIGVGYPLGPAPLGTGVLRYFYYRRLGIGLEAFAKLALLIMVTAVMGKFSFTSLVLLYDASHAALWFRIDEAIVTAFAVMSLVGTALYALVCLLWHRHLHLRIGAWSFALPNIKIALAQVALGIVNYACIAACLHQLMSASAPISYSVVATAYMAANFAVLLTHVPGGWGVMEFVLLSVLPGLDAIGAVIAFRAIYYLVPLALGILLFVTVEGPAALKALVSRRASA
jgi:glycosyltransferase 2 family protein